MIKQTLLSACCATLFLTGSVQGQSIFENTYVWEDGINHSGWKAMLNNSDDFVIVGSKFFQTSNTQVFMTGFNDFSEHEFTTTHTTAQHGFTQLQTFWKSFTNIGDASNPIGFFIATTGQRNGSLEYYTMHADKNGVRTVERFGPLGGGVQFGGACPAVGGGFIVVGSDNGGNIAVARFSALGDLVTSTALPISGFAWTVQPAPGGGYVIGSTRHTATRVDDNFNVDWSTTVTLPASPPHDGSQYTYSEFEEIVPLENTGSGFVMTGSTFSNSTSAVYTTRITWDGIVEWSLINDFADTSQPGTPVTWTNSAVERFNMITGLWEIFYTWRHGPVSAGGTLFYDRMNPATGASQTSGSLLNTIPVQEAFTVRQHFGDRIVIAGTRGSYDAAYSYATCNVPGEADVTPPVVICPPDVTQPNDPGQCSAVVNYGPASALDNCDRVSTVTCTPPSGTIFPVGTTVVTCSSTDSAGNTGTCTFNVTVTDTTPPTITCPANITTGTANFASSAAVFFPAPTVLDNCPGAQVVFSPPSGSVLPLGTTTVTATAIDVAGNTASCTFTVSVFDVVLQDNSNPGRSFYANSATGEYIFCCDGSVFTGNARVRTRRCNINISGRIPGQTLNVSVNKCRNRGNAKLRLSRRSICRINDGNTVDSRPICP